MTIVNDDPRVVNKLKASLTDDIRVVIYDCHMFIVQATVRHAKRVSEVLGPNIKGLNLTPGKVSGSYCLVYFLYFKTKGVYTKNI
jgi:hypothetical protein